MSWGETLPVNSISFHTPRLCLCVCVCVCVCVCTRSRVCSQSHVQLFATPWTVVCQAPLSKGFSRQEYWSGLSFPSPGDLPGPGIKPESLASPALAGRFFTTVPHPQPRRSVLMHHLSKLIFKASQLECQHSRKTFYFFFFFQNLCFYDLYLAFVLFCLMEQFILLDDILKHF